MQWVPHPSRTLRRVGVGAGGVQYDSISTTPSSPGTSQRQRTGVSALHKPIIRALHQSALLPGYGECSAAFPRALVKRAKSRSFASVKMTKLW
jgi:hypothetical protein